MSELASVVLTGFGAITARGDWTSRNWLDFQANSSTESADFALRNFALEKYLESQKTYLDRASALALAGCALALRDANVKWPVEDEEFGITLGTHLGCVETMRGFWDKAMERGVRVANPLLFSHSYFNSPISLCAIEYGLKGYHTTVCAGEESGREAVRAAFDAIRLGHAQAMICGAVEAISPTRSAGEPQHANGEAAVFLVLENSKRAAQREAGVLLEVTAGLLESETTPETVNEQFGRCGGAQSTLDLLWHWSSAQV